MPWILSGAALLTACQDSGANASTSQSGTSSATTWSGNDETSTIDDSTETGSSPATSGLFVGTETETDGVQDECPDAELGGDLPLSVEGDNTIALDDYAPTCAKRGGGPDAEFVWTPASSGYYQVTTRGSALDTVVAVVAGACSPDGLELGCHDDAALPDNLFSTLFIELEQDEPVTIYVDGYDGALDTFVLTVEEAVCPTEIDLGTDLPAETSGTTAGDSHFGGSCAGAGPEARVSWTAPADGTYVFSSAGSSFDTVVYLLDTTCPGPELASNHHLGDEDLHACVEHTMSAGETVMILVDGFTPTAAGDYMLHIDTAGTKGCAGFAGNGAIEPLER